MKKKTPPEQAHPAQNLEAEDLQCLGECVRDLVVRLGNETDPALFREAVDAAISLLTTRQRSRVSLKAYYAERGGYEPVSPPISLKELAEEIIAGKAVPEPPYLEAEELQARIQCALALDPSCAEAYFLQADLQERQGQYQKALASYQKAMQFAKDSLDPAAFQKTRKAAQRMHFWYNLEARLYMRARAALAYLLWQKLGRTREAIGHFQGMLDLNPGDNQGNRYALLCALLEVGDDDALAAALKRHRFYKDEFGEKHEIAETCWWYTNACWTFRQTTAQPERFTRQEATSALRTAFTYNRHVPAFLLDPEHPAAFGEPDAYARGDENEAAWYANFSVKGWQQSPGALQWLAETARQAGLWS
jgi:tetratricopeptide (TPR) repeat protein